MRRVIKQQIIDKMKIISKVKDLITLAVMKKIYKQQQIRGMKSLNYSYQGYKRVIVFDDDSHAILFLCWEHVFEFIKERELQNKIQSN